MISYFEKVFMLIGGHFLADFPFQDEHMAKTKNSNYVPDYIPEGQTPTPIWFYSLGGHGMIHGLMVFLVTNRLDLAIIETLSHILIDYAKGKNWTNPHLDQITHITMKFIYAAMIV